MKIIFMKPKKAALCVLYGLFYGCKHSEWIGPKYFNIWGLPKIKKINTATQDEIINIRNKTNEIIGKLN